MKCQAEGCKSEKAICRGFCSKHYWRWRKYGDPSVTTRPRYDGSVKCVVAGCDKAAVSKAMCRSHLRAMTLYGDPTIRVKAPAGESWPRTGRYVMSGKKLEHISIAETAIGRKLPRGAEVHHVDEEKSNNYPSNLVICPNSAYHKLLHRRARAFAACGNASWLRCCYCKKYDAPENIVTIHGTKQDNWYHKLCRRNYRINLARTD